MKLGKKITGILVGMGISGSVFAAQTYPLKCRPGPNTSFNLSVSGDLRFSFVKASGPAGQDGSRLRPGECSWVDRAIGPSEPGVFAAATGPKFKIGTVVPHIQNNSFKAYLYAQNQAWVMDFQQHDRILTIHVFNDGQYMRAPNP